ELAAGFCQSFLQDGDGFGMKVQAHTESLRHAIGGDVVVGRADTAGGKHIGVFHAQPVESLHDRGGVVGDNPHLFQVNADGGEVIGDIADVPVLGAARQDLVADHQHGSGDDVGFCAHLDVPAGGCKDLAWPQWPLKRPLASALNYWAANVRV